MVAENILMFISSPADAYSGGNIQSGPVLSRDPKERELRLCHFSLTAAEHTRRNYLKRGMSGLLAYRISFFTFMCDMKVQCKS